MAKMAKEKKNEHDTKASNGWLLCAIVFNIIASIAKEECCYII